MNDNNEDPNAIFREASERFLENTRQMLREHMKTEDKRKKTPNIILYYCKSLKNEGKPIIVKNLDTNSDYATDEVYLENVNIRMKFQNVPKDDKERGVTTVLEVFKR